MNEESGEIVVAEPYCERGNCFSTYHLIRDGGWCAWCGRSVTSLTVHARYVSAKSVAPPLTAGPVAPSPDLEESIARLREHVRRRSMSHTERFETTAERFYNETGLVAPGKSMPVEMWSDDYDARRNAAWVVFNKQVHDTFYADLERAIQALEAQRGAARPPQPQEIDHGTGLALPALRETDRETDPDAAERGRVDADAVSGAEHDGSGAATLADRRDSHGREGARPPASPPALEAWQPMLQQLAEAITGQSPDEAKTWTPQSLCALARAHRSDSEDRDEMEARLEAALAVPPEAPPP